MKIPVEIVRYAKLPPIEKVSVEFTPTEIQALLILIGVLDWKTYDDALTVHLTTRYGRPYDENFPPPPKTGTILGAILRNIADGIWKAL
jgi:hypothetical protein